MVEKPPLRREPPIPSRSPDITVTIDGEEYDAAHFSYSKEAEFDEVMVADEYEMTFFPDKHGGISFPVPKGPHKLRHIQTGEYYIGEVAFSGVIPDDLKNNTEFSVKIDEEHQTRTFEFKKVEWTKVRYEANDNRTTAGDFAALELNPELTS